MKAKLVYLFAQVRRSPWEAAEAAWWCGLGLAYLAWAHQHSDPEPMLTGFMVGVGVSLLGLVALYLHGLTPPRCWCGHRHWDDDEDDGPGDEGPTEYGKAA